MNGKHEMNIQILPILLSPLGSMPAQAPDVSAGLMFLLILIVVNVIGPVIIMPTAGYFAARSSRDSQAIFISTVTGIAIGVITAFLWWKLFPGELWPYFPSIDEWYSTALILIFLFSPNPIGILITVFAVRKILFRIHKIRSQDSAVG